MLIQQRISHFTGNSPLSLDAYDLFLHMNALRKAGFSITISSGQNEGPSLKTEYHGTMAPEEAIEQTIQTMLDQNEIVQEDIQILRKSFSIALENVV